MTQEQLHQLLDSLRRLPKENEWIEFKVNNFDPYKVGASLCALANGANLHNQPYGYLIFGIKDDDHSIIGTDIIVSKKKVGNEEFENWLLRKMEPRPNVTIFEFQIKETNIIVIQITAAIDRPVGFRDNNGDRIEYIRVGSYTKQLFEYPEKERTIWRNEARSCFEKEVAKTNLTSDEVLSLLDYPKYFELAKQVLPSTKEGIIDRFEREGFIISRSGSYSITNLGAVLLAKNLREFETVSRKALRIIVYKDRGKSKVHSERQNHKGYAVDFEDAVAYINERLPANEAVKGALREEQRMYPEIAIREFLANALIHQDFDLRGMGPMVEIFKDRMEISNPGIPLIKPERFIDGRQSRNERLASVLRLLHICEERGQGVDKALFEIEFFQLPAPNFYSDEELKMMLVTLYAARPISQMDKIDRIRACYQHCCLKWVSGEPASNETLRKRFNLPEGSKATVSKIINDTIAEKLIVPANPLNHSKKYAKYKPFWA